MPLTIHVERANKSSSKNCFLIVEINLITTRIYHQLFLLTKITQTFEVHHRDEWEIVGNVNFCLKCARAAVVKITFRH